MDLDRLRIPENGHAARSTPIVPLIVVGVLAFCLGFGASFLFGVSAKSGKVKVKTAVVKPSSADSGKAFTAGGWIEVAKPQYPIFIAPRISEQVVELLVKEGQDVQPKQVLVRLNDLDVKNELEIARAMLANAKANYDIAVAGYRAEDIAASKAALDEAEQSVRAASSHLESVNHSLQSASADIEELQEALRIAIANLSRAKNLPPELISPQEIDNLQSKVTTAEAKLKKGQTDYARAQAALQNAKDELEGKKARAAAAAAEHAKRVAGFRAEEIAQAKAAFDEATKRVELQERRLDYCTLKAPDSGKTLRVLKVYAFVGQWINNNERADLVALYDPKELQARVDVTQGSIGSVSVGASCIVTTDAHPNKEYKGTVLRVEPLAELSKNTITVRVGINDPDEKLFPEMVARIAFLAGASSSSTAGITLPATAISSDAGESFVFVVEGGKAVRKQVVVGAAAAGRVPVFSGLTTGQKVIISGLEAVKDGSPVEEQ